MTQNEQKFRNWPELTKEEFRRYYDEIKANKILDLGWQNPGRLEPSMVDGAHDKQPDAAASQNDGSGTDAEMRDNNEQQVQSENQNQFDLFDEFSKEIEENNSTQLLRLTHAKTPRDSDKKVACMDKILDDMRKKYETNTSGL